MNAPPKEFLKDLIANNSGISIHSLELTGVGGGSINDTYQVKINNSTKLFLKLNKAGAFPGLFEKEMNGLHFLAGQQCIGIPSVIAHTVNEEHQFLLLEWIEGGIRSDQFWKNFGEQLAALHHVSHHAFGFAENNYMGSLPQLNTFAANWVDFFAGCRLQPQIELALHNHLLDKSHVSGFHSLFKKLGSVFADEKPSLLHGDLWSGNYMCNQHSQPVLIDPAVYFGHRSIDLAMTTLFGGFDKLFYEAYDYHFPLPANYREQWDICNLYPLLIHLNLFGRSYLPEIAATLRKFA